MYQFSQQSGDGPDVRLESPPTTLVGEMKRLEREDTEMNSSMILFPGAKVQSLE